MPGTPVVAQPSTAPLLRHSLNASVPFDGLRLKTITAPFEFAAAYAFFPSGLTTTFQAPRKPGTGLQPGVVSLAARHWRFIGRHWAEAGTAVRANATLARAIAHLNRLDMGRR